MGGCQCADAFYVGEAIDESDVERVAEVNRHQSIRQLVADGDEVITF